MKSIAKRRKLESLRNAVYGLRFAYHAGGVEMFPPWGDDIEDFEACASIMVVRFGVNAEVVHRVMRGIASNMRPDVAVSNETWRELIDRWAKDLQHSVADASAHSVDEDDCPPRRRMLPHKRNGRQKFVVNFAQV